MRRIRLFFGLGLFPLLVVLSFSNLRLRFNDPTHTTNKIEAFEESVRPEGHRLLHQSTPPGSIISKPVTNVQYPWVQQRCDYAKQLLHNELKKMFELLEIYSNV